MTLEDLELTPQQVLQLVVNLNERYPGQFGHTVSAFKFELDMENSWQYKLYKAMRKGSSR